MTVSDDTDYNKDKLHTSTRENLNNRNNENKMLYISQRIRILTSEAIKKDLAYAQMRQSAKDTDNTKE